MLLLTAMERKPPLVFKELNAHINLTCFASITASAVLGKLSITFSVFRGVLTILPEVHF